MARKKRERKIPKHTHTHKHIYWKKKTPKTTRKTMPLQSSISAVTDARYHSPSVPMCVFERALNIYANIKHTRQVFVCMASRLSLFFLCFVFWNMPIASHQFFIWSFHIYLCLFSKKAIAVAIVVVVFLVVIIVRYIFHPSIHPFAFPWGWQRQPHLKIDTIAKGKLHEWRTLVSLNDV